MKGSIKTGLPYNLLFILVFCISQTGLSQRKPNIIFILTDDMGFGDIHCFNGTYQTPAIDRLAAEGRKFTSYYSASPICSPSRVGFLTGMAPAEWNITSYLQTRKGNRECEQADFLAREAPSIAHVLKAGGYKTAHFGKWHMGGGRDVTDAPSIYDYGFDEYSSTWESPDPDPLLTATNWIWSDEDSIKRWNRTAYFVDKTLAFLEKNKDKPCYVNLWPDDVHTPWVAGDDKVGKYPGGPQEEKSFIAVLNEYDKQMGRLLEGIKKLGLDDNTIIVFTSDNGPLPNFRNDRSAGMRGSKLSLYEGGIRMPFIVRWPGHIMPGTTDSTSVITAADLFLSFSRFAVVALPANYQSDGEDRSSVLEGNPQKRRKGIFWEYGRNETSFKYPEGKGRSPSLAIREGDWKLLMNRDGSGTELYNIQTDRNETVNLAGKHPALVKGLKKKLLKWWQQLPVAVKEN